LNKEEVEKCQMEYELMDKLGAFSVLSARIKMFSEKILYE
jgi:hypothetical protein